MRMKVTLKSLRPGLATLLIASSLFLLFHRRANAAPVVSNIRIDDVGHSSARITWDSDVTSVSQRVQYGTSTSYGNIQGTYQSATVAASQQMLVTGLAPSTTYHVCPQSTTDNRNWSDCVDASFTTADLPAVHPSRTDPAGGVGHVDAHANGELVYRGGRLQRCVYGASALHEHRGSWRHYQHSPLDDKLHA